MHFRDMSEPWFFDPVLVDHAALDELRHAALRTATALEGSADERIAAAGLRLRWCAGPFADDLADEVLRADGEDRALADACRALAAAADAAGDAALAEQRRRLELQDAYRAELARDAARAAEGAATPSTSAVGAVGTGASR